MIQLPMPLPRASRGIFRHGKADFRAAFHADDDFTRLMSGGTGAPPVTRKFMVKR